MGPHENIAHRLWMRACHAPFVARPAARHSVTLFNIRIERRRCLPNRLGPIDARAVVRMRICETLYYRAA